MAMAISNRVKNTFAFEVAFLLEYFLRERIADASDKLVSTGSLYRVHF